jgi:hypothetical protein
MPFNRELMSSRISLAVWIGLFLVIYFSGYFYLEIEQSGQVLNRTGRAVSVALVFVLMVLLVLGCRNADPVPMESWLLLLFLVYAAILSLSKVNFSVYASYLIRLASYFGIFYVGLSFRGEQANGVRIATRLLGLTLVVQLLIDILLSRYLIINGAIRFPGSIGSPVGYSAAALVIFLPTAYFFSQMKKPIDGILAVGLSIVVFATATRATSVVVFLYGSILLLLSREWGLKSWVITLLLWLFVVAGSLQSISTFFGEPAGPLPRIFSVDSISSTSESVAQGAQGAQGAQLASSTKINIEMLAATSADSSVSTKKRIVEIVYEHSDEIAIFEGMGLGSFPNWYQKHSGDSGVAPHFEILWLVFETGLIGATIYLIFHILIFCKYLKIASIGQDRFADVFFLVSILLTHMLFLHLANPLYFYQVGMPLFFYLGYFSGCSAKVNLNAFMGEKIE